jgi:hypothetical protein
MGRAAAGDKYSPAYIFGKIPDLLLAVGQEYMKGEKS